MIRDEAIDALLQQKEQLESQLLDLMDKAENDAQKATIRGAYQRALDQWNEAVNRKLVADETMVRGLVVQLGEINDQVNLAIAHGEEFGAVLNRIASGVLVGAKILSLLR